MHHHAFSKVANHLFALPVMLLASGLLLLPASSASASAFHQTLLAVLACLGACLALLYGRMRQLFMVLAVYVGFLIAHNQSTAFFASGRLGPHAALFYHSLCLWLPIAFACNGLWRERGRPMMDLARRALVHVVVLVVYTLIAAWRPEQITALLAHAWLPGLPLRWSALPPLATFTLCVSVLALVVQAVWKPSGEHTAMALSGMGLAVMLPRVFADPHVVPTLSAAIMLLLITALIQETFVMTFRDELTGLRGRRALNDCLARLRGNYAIAMVDVDHFKSFNDTYGHETGDQVLRLVASRLSRVGGGGQAYRYGGEEFALVFFNKLSADCKDEVEAMRKIIESARMRLRDQASRPNSDAQGRSKRGSGGDRGEVKITVSIGLADSRTVSGGPQAVIEAADQSLYAAKAGGRNQVRVARRVSVAKGASTAPPRQAAA